MHDPRKPRRLKPHALSLLVIDANAFTRGLITDILRNFDATDIHAAKDVASAETTVREKPIDVIIMSWEKEDGLDGMRFVRNLRRVKDDRIRRLPVLFVTSGLTKQLVIDARDAGVDEFLSKPIAPAAVRQRLEMVIETPRPFVDCAVYIGPCRRRKNPADYHGAKRRAGDRSRDDESTPTVDHDEEAQKSPIRVALADVRVLSASIRANDAATLNAVMAALANAKQIATECKDHALISALAAYEAYVSVSAPQGQTEATVVNTALGALEQLATLPVGFTEARESVAIALGKAIQRKLAA